MRGFKIYLIFSIILAIISETKALYGYDCGDHISNLTTISLNEVGSCNIPKPNVKTTKIAGQVLQLNEFAVTQVYKCSVQISRTITHCGWQSHASRVKGGEVSYYKELTERECMGLQYTGAYSLGGTPIMGIHRNSTTRRILTLAGTVEQDGSCTGGSYSDDYGNWEKVLVAGWVEITLQDYTATVKLDYNQIMLNTGRVCELSKLECIDLDAGHVFWKALPNENCASNKYSVLYDNMINKIQEEETDRIMYSLESEQITFSLWKTGQETICGVVVSRTEHPKLFILEDAKALAFIKPAPIAAANIDIFLYMNSKFLYVVEHFRGELQKLYYDILKHKCELERKVFMNALSIASLSPAEFGFRLMEESGYMGVVAGEVVHLLKCLRVEVSLRNATSCYDQLPVYRGNEEYFLTPRTRILIRSGTPRSCDIRLPAMYKLGALWYKMLPGAIESKEPEILKPQTKPTWKYVSPETLGISGIYGETDLSRVRDMILFPMERTIVLNKLALGASGRVTFEDELSIINLIDKKTLQSLAESTWNRVWKSFMTFSTASAGIIGIFLLFRIGKLIIDTIIHGYAIYSLYGFSIHLIGAVWNSVTQLLLHLGNQAKEREEKKEKQQKVEEKTNEPIYCELPTEEEYENLKPKKNSI